MKVDFKVIGYGRHELGFIWLQDGDRWWVLVRTVMNFLVPCKAEFFLTS
jgi:hypothetical protein